MLSCERLGPRRARIFRRFVYVAYGLSGLSALVFEIVWARALATVMGSSTYAMSTVLAAFMAGLAVGALGGSWLASKVKDPGLAFAGCELGIGVVGLLIHPLIRSLTPLYVAAYYRFHLSFSTFSVVQFVIAFALMGLPTTLMGLGFALVVKLTAREERSVAEESGRLYGVNTLGAVAGCLLAGFVLVPWLGASRTAMLAGALNVTSGLVILGLLRRWRVAGAGAAAAALVAAWVGPQQAEVPFFSYAAAHRYDGAEVVLRVAEAVRAGGQDVVLFHSEGVEGEVWLTRHTGANGRVDDTLINNGKYEAGGAPPFDLLAYLPYFTHAAVAPVHTALNIGLGSGHTLRALSRLPLEHIESVELSDGILEANRRFLTPEFFRDPRVHHTQADGRNFLLVTKQRYDVIVVSPSWATEQASAALLTDEFFALAASRLHDTGVLATWVDFSMMPEANMRLLLRTFAKNFRHVTAWRMEGGDLVLVGANMSTYPEEPAVASEVLGFEPTMAGIFSLGLSDHVARPETIDEVNDDDHPVIEFDNARTFVLGPGSLAAEPRP